jgi:hypothetical protein
MHHSEARPQEQSAGSSDVESHSHQTELYENEEQTPTVINSPLYQIFCPLLSSTSPIASYLTSAFDRRLFLPYCCMSTFYTL